jgi:hypothetical protein
MTARSKPFQAATVKAATAALSGGNPRRRFLVADEVGLGKTVVARDTLAALASKARKFTVYYITSGLKVADQNKVELLRSLDKEDAKDALSTIDRIGLIPFEEKRKGKLRLYAFTPTTSFSSSQRLYGGKAVERAFIKLLLNELYPGLTETFPEGYIEYGASSGWPWACDEAQGKFDNVSAQFKAAYGRALRMEFGKPARENILRAIETSRHGQSLGRMRKALAQAALDSAPPDLIIFDEFQCPWRFNCWQEKMEGRRRRSSSCPPRPTVSMRSVGKAALGALPMLNFSRLSSFSAGRLYALRPKPNFVGLAISCI